MSKAIIFLDEDEVTPAPKKAKVEEKLNKYIVIIKQKYLIKCGLLESFGINAVSSHLMYPSQSSKLKAIMIRRRRSRVVSCDTSVLSKMLLL